MSASQEIPSTSRIPAQYQSNPQNNNSAQQQNPGGNKPDYTDAWIRYFKQTSNLSAAENMLLQGNNTPPPANTNHPLIPTPRVSSPGHFHHNPAASPTSALTRESILALQQERIRAQEIEALKHLGLAEQQSLMLKKQQHTESKKAADKAAKDEQEKMEQHRAAAGFYQSTQPYQGTPEQQQAAYEAWMQEYQRLQDSEMLSKVKKEC